MPHRRLIHTSSHFPLQWPSSAPLPSPPPHHHRRHHSPAPATGSPPAPSPAGSTCQFASAPAPPPPLKGVEATPSGPPARTRPPSRPASPSCGRPPAARARAGQEAEAREKRAEGGTGTGSAASESADEWAGETVFYDGPPHRGDVAVNVALGTTLVWLPLTFASLGRALWVHYRVTSKRVTVTQNPPWATGEPTQVAFFFSFPL